MEVLRYAAFSVTSGGGNPAGVVLDATGVAEDLMLATAAQAGYSETAFFTPRGAGEFDVRYFSPLAEVSFCGHATVAGAVAYAQRHGTGDLLLHTKAGPVPVRTADTGEQIQATLTSVAPRTEALPEADLRALLAALRWPAGDPAEPMIRWCLRTSAESICAGLDPPGPSAAAPATQVSHPGTVCGARQGWSRTAEGDRAGAARSPQPVTASVSARCRGHASRRTAACCPGSRPGRQRRPWAGSRSWTCPPARAAASDRPRACCR